MASIRYFYPEIPIRLLAGDILQRGLAEELKRYWGVELVDLPKGDYGWGLVKLEPLFGPRGQSFLVMDVDTVLTGRLLDVRAESGAPFFVDDERQSDADFKRLYYDWDKLRESMDGLDVESVAKGTAPPLVIHWAGMKKTFLRDMVGADLLVFFETFYYQRLPAGKFRRVLAICYSVWLQWKHFIWVRTKLTCRKWFGFGLSKNARPEIVKQSVGGCYLPQNVRMRPRIDVYSNWRV